MLQQQDQKIPLPTRNHLIFLYSTELFFLNQKTTSASFPFFFERDAISYENKPALQLPSEANSALSFQSIV